MSVISVSNIGKAYRSYRSEWQRFARWFGMPVKPAEEHWVLRNISFEVQPGEAIGIIGQNGAGKSTLLKMIVGTLKPTEGHVQVNGRVSAILELGMGFNPELTGRQNAFHASGLMGFNKEQINEVMSDIEAFAEIGEYFDEPVRTYSSGMQVRVAFAVATSWRPDILIVDEALSVGDAYFQQKSFARMLNLQKQGSSFLIVTHDTNAIKTLCDRAILIDSGAIIKEDSPENVSNHYNSLIQKQDKVTIKKHKIIDKVETEYGNNEASFVEIKLINSKGKPVKVINVGEKIKFCLKIIANKNIERLILGFGVSDYLGRIMFGTNTKHTGQIIKNINKGEIISCDISFLANLGIGNYSIGCTLVDSLIEEGMGNRNIYHWRDSAFMFEVVNSDKNFFIGCIWNEMNFHLEKQI